MGSAHTIHKIAELNQSLQFYDISVYIWSFGIKIWKKMSADHCGDLAALAGWLFTI